MSFELWCAKLTAWRRGHDGAIPRQKSGNAEEDRLANWVSMTLPRKARSLGTKPSKQKLTREQVAMLDQALAPDLCQRRVASVPEGLQDDTDCTDDESDAACSSPNKRLRPQTSAPAAPGLCFSAVGSSACGESSNNIYKQHAEIAGGFSTALTSSRIDTQKTIGNHPEQWADDTLVDSLRDFVERYSTFPRRSQKFGRTLAERLKNAQYRGSLDKEAQAQIEKLRLSCAAPSLVSRLQRFAEEHDSQLPKQHAEGKTERRLAKELNNSLTRQTLSDEDRRAVLALRQKSLEVQECRRVKA